MPTICNMESSALSRDIIRKNFTVDLSRKRRYQEVISRLDSIPPLATAAQAVLSALAQDPKDILELEHTIRYDPSLTSQLLKVANCAAYAPRTPIDTVHRAIVYLGFSEVCNISLGLSVLGMFRNSTKNLGFSLRDFWTHSIATAMIARILAEELEEEEPEIYFTAGLLHDLGRLALNYCFPMEWQDIVALAGEGNLPLIKAERLRLGLSHSLVGAWLAKTWKLPKVYVKAIATHHLPMGHKKACTVGALIQLADYLSHTAGMGLMSPPGIKKTAILAYLGLSPEMVESMERQLHEMEEVAETIAEMLLIMK